MKTLRSTMILLGYSPSQYAEIKASFAEIARLKAAFFEGYLCGGQRTIDLQAETEAAWEASESYVSLGESLKQSDVK